MRSASATNKQTHLLEASKPDSHNQSWWNRTAGVTVLNNAIRIQWASTNLKHRADKCHLQHQAHLITSTIARLQRSCREPWHPSTDVPMYATIATVTIIWDASLATPPSSLRPALTSAGQPERLERRTPHRPLVSHSSVKRETRPPTVVALASSLSTGGTTCISRTCLKPIPTNIQPEFVLVIPSSCCHEFQFSQAMLTSETERKS